MSPEPSDKAQSENKTEKKFPFSLGDIIKFIGAFAVIIPLILGYIQYQQQVRENLDENFRAIVSGLSSERKQNRLASASNLGTFIKEGSPYYNEAVDILINTVSIESDIDVLQAIRSSLEKISFEDNKKVIQKLLKLEQNFFIYDEYLKVKLRTEQEIAKKELQRYKELLAFTETPKTSLKENELELETYKNRYLASITRHMNLELSNKENPFRSELVAKFIVSFLSVARKNPMAGLELYQNSWNYVVLTDLKLPEINIYRSALSSTTISAVDFSHAMIEDTTFENSIIEDSNISHSTIHATLFNSIVSLKGTQFKGATLTDVFFYDSDLKGADFTGAKGLKPAYFYKARNLDQAVFDADFANRLKQVDAISEADFMDYLCDSDLSPTRRAELSRDISGEASIRCD
ncbi:Pentapeptide repeat-containing protein [Nitrosomonas marina]|uniref:Pentapeptide repeat-containing protein n=1 Tax=Nitrosomonas marina TaxID=917 RepID=A0A1I0FAW2_9PROT|nr:pentapeptide repeat-containing protein [Nitrosomonas marina]SET55260.1 Pentapeptide repeat-containing protein [Nitrosomonas marina]